MVAASAKLILSRPYLTSTSSKRCALRGSVIIYFYSCHLVSSLLKTKATSLMGHDLRLQKSPPNERLSPLPVYHAGDVKARYALSICHASRPLLPPSLLVLTTIVTHSVMEVYLPVRPA